MRKGLKLKWMSKKSKNFYTVGIDEVGRGSLAGPVVVTALVLPKNLRLNPPIRQRKPKIRDSKHLTAIQRRILFGFLKKHPRISYVTKRALPRTVDKINVSKAANLVATRAFVKLAASQWSKVTRARVFLDGGLYLIKKALLANGHTLNPKTIIKGDEKINAIKLASVVAKVTRDNYMTKLHKKYPKYSFDRHKGYGTKKHMRAIKKYGPCEVHRLTFIP